MADELQALLDKINDEGIKKAEQQQQAILEQARQEAARIIARAKEQADTLTANAENNAALLTQKGEEALRQAARDILLTLRNELQTRVRQATADLMRQTLDGDRLAAVIAEVITAYVRDRGSHDDLQVLVPADRLQTLEAAVKARLEQSLRADGRLAPAPGLAAGFKLAFNGSDVLYDFSDQSLAEAVAAYVGPRIAAALQP